jgi:hypothetical protein
MPQFIEPMNLGNMRANGVRTLDVWCDGLGHHHRILDVSGYPDDVLVPSFGPRMVCTVCGGWMMSFLQDGNFSKSCSALRARQSTYPPSRVDHPFDFPKFVEG